LFCIGIPIDWFRLFQGCKTKGISLIELKGEGPSNIFFKDSPLKTPVSFGSKVSNSFLLQVNQFPWQVAIEIKDRDGKLPTLILQYCFVKNLLAHEFFERQNQQDFFLAL
jgi:hypothetical protein